MNHEEEQFINDLVTQNQTLQSQNSQLQSQYSQVSSYAGTDNDNLIKWQLDLEKEKEKVYHLLQGHKLVLDAQGNYIWEEPADPIYKPLTNYGVEQLINILEFYLSRNTLLSFYEDNQINNKMFDIGIEISDKIFLEYEYIFNKPSVKDLLKRDKEIINKLGEKYKDDPKQYRLYKRLLKAELEMECDEIFKKNIKQFPMVVRMLVDTIHSAYLRALEGGERESLRTARHVSQTDNSAQQYMMPSSPGGGKFSILKPKTWS